jgi:hypothetical protein
MNPQWAAGSGFVVHRSGKRLTAAECERVRVYILAEIDNPSWSREATQARERDLANLNEAIAASFPEQQERVA